MNTKGEMGRVKGRKAPWRHDPRSKKFSHHQFFGTIKPSELPVTLGRKLRPVENQKETMRCTGYGCAMNGGYIHNMRMHPDWQAAKIGQLQHESVDVSGGDPNAAMRSQRDFGYLPFNLAPILSIDSNTTLNTGMNSFDPTLDMYAYDNRVEGFVNVDGNQDTFDNIRSALVQAYDATTGKGACVQLFGKWYYDWYPHDGIIPTNYGTTQLTYHHWVIVDFKSINGISYLIVQNSAGTGMGDGGFFYFPREVVNREWNTEVWGVTRKIVKPITPEQIALGKQESPAGRLQRLIFDIWYKISEYIINRK